MKQSSETVCFNCLHWKASRDYKVRDSGDSLVRINTSPKDVPFDYRKREGFCRVGFHVEEDGGVELPDTIASQLCIVFNEEGEYFFTFLYENQDSEYVG